MYYLIIQSTPDRQAREAVDKQKKAAQELKLNVEFQDPLIGGGRGPLMVVIPGGSLQIPDTGPEMNKGERQHVVEVQTFAIGKYEVTIEQFRRFVDSTSYKTEAEQSGEGCSDSDDWNKQNRSKNWRDPGFYQDDAYPVVCVSWNDATAYVKWLSKQTSQNYSLPTETQWEYATRAGIGTAYYWGDDPYDGCNYANAFDQTPIIQFSRQDEDYMECHDKYVYTAPVGTFQPNPFGLHDMLGNVWEWTCSKYDQNYGINEQKTCDNSDSSDGRRVLRGGSWYDGPRRWGVKPQRWRGLAGDMDSAHRRLTNRGFRLARTFSL